jgi:hypothetical protein
MLTDEEIKTIMTQKKCINLYDKYLEIYHQLTGNRITGCGGCRMNWVYNQIHIILKNNKKL